ncbi:sodium-dependent low-affinity dicarboxylate transporter 1-like isoform X2 [Ornithodoros turicata]|uniref:sodium-dependent low-affinity dicarboxylate transporter 1-like isoform X2 n=1 Tax=Ornithodoros turicata TaxID=34597 RepID=UPI0031387802
MERLSTQMNPSEMRRRLPSNFEEPQLAQSKYANTWVVDYLVSSRLTDEQLLRQDVEASNQDRSTEPRVHRTPSAGSPRKEGASLRSKLLQKHASILEYGQVYIPGDESPGKETSLPPGSSSERRASIREIIAWRPERYEDINNGLIVGVTVASSLCSMVAQNRSSQYVDEYFRRRFHENVITPVMWWFIILPVEVFALCSFWIRMKVLFLKTHDAPESEEAAIGIQRAIRRMQGNNQDFKYTEVIPTAFFATWTVVYAYNIFDWEDQPWMSLEFDYLLTVLMLAAHCQWWAGDTTLDGRKLMAHLPWDAIIICFTSHVLGFTVQEYGLAAFISSRLMKDSSTTPQLTQLLLTFLSAIITEVTADSATVAIFMPVSIQMGIQCQYHPLYFALPVSVAASTSLILPTGCMAIALLNGLTDIRSWDMVLIAMITKVGTVMAILILVNTVGSFLFDWKSLPEWLSRGPNVTVNATPIVAGTHS